MGGLIGRTRELAQLEQALARARAGQGRLVLVAGQPGIGKSRLVDEAARAVAATTRVIWGRCWEAGGAPPFWPWIQVLRAVRREVGDLEVPLEIARILPELGGDSAASAPVAEARFLLFDAIHRYLSAAASAMPLVVVFEDLHAADVASLQVLAFFAAHLRGESIAVIGTHRTRAGEVRALIDRLARDAETIEPRPLGRDDIAALARENGVDDARAIDAIARASEGNPLFVRELVRLGAGVIPDTVRAAIREHLVRVPERSRVVAERAALLGGEVSRELARLAELGDRELARALGELVEHGVLVERAPGRFAFAHGLFAETLVYDLDPAERERLHGRAADLLAGSGASTSELARHLFAAGPARAGDAIAAARRGAVEASRQLAFDEAAVLLERAVAASAQPDLDLASELAIAQILKGDAKAGIETCNRAIELARAAGDGARMARLVSVYGRVITPGKTDHALVALIEETLRALPAGDSAERAGLLARLASALQPAADPYGPIAIARDAIAMARRLGEPRVALDVLYTALAALANFAPADERRALDLEVLQLATAHHEPSMVLRSHYRLVLDCLSAGDVAGALEHQRAYTRLANDMRQPHVGWVAAEMRALFALHAGQLAEYEAESEEATRLLADSGANVWWRHAFHLMAKVAIGDEAGLRAERDALDSWVQGAFPIYEVMTRAYVEAHTGELARARMMLARLTVREVLTFSDAWVASWMAELAVRVGDREMAGELYAGILPWRARWCVSGIPNLSIGPSLEHSLGLLAAALGRDREARAHFATAIGELRAADLPVLLARSLVEWATCGSATRDEARTALAEARELATAFGLPLLDRIDRLGQLSLPPPVAVAAAPALALVHEGGTWHVTFADASCRVRHSRGMELLARLIADPTRELHVLELVGADGADAGDSGEVLDRDAIAAYRARAAELREQLEGLADPHRRDRARAELEALEDQLAAGVGLGGRPRRASNAAERARVNVQRRIADAVRRIAEAAPAIGRHLDAAVRTGTYCSYAPRRDARKP